MSRNTPWLHDIPFSQICSCELFADPFYVGMSAYCIPGPASLFEEFKVK